MDVGNLISGSSAFSKSTYTPGSSQFMYCWSLAWRILSTLLACEMSTIVRQFDHSLVSPFFGIGMKTEISSPVATAEFSKFANWVQHFHSSIF